MSLAAARLGMAGLALGSCAVVPPAVFGASRLPPALTEPLRTCVDGGFALPGSATCLRLSGRVEVQTVLRSSSRASAAPAGRGVTLRDQVRGGVAVDVRTPTELGPLRVYTSVRVDPLARPDIVGR